MHVFHRSLCFSFSRIRSAVSGLGCLMAVLLAASPLSAQTVLNYTNGQVDANDHDLSGSGTTTLDITSGTATLRGALYGNGGLGKTGVGTIVLTGLSSYQGNTNIDAGTLQLSASSSLSVDNYGVTLGSSGVSTADLLIDGGALGSGAVALGLGDLGSTATVTVRNGGFWTNGGSINLGLNSGTTGIVNLSSGSIATTSLMVGFGFGSSGVFNFSGGSVSAGDSVLGFLNNVTGTAHVSGGIWTSTNELTVGYYGSGRLNLSGGSISSDAGIFVGRDFTLGVDQSSGVVNVSGGSLSTPSTLTVGDFGIGVLNITGGSVSADTVMLGGNVDFSGVVGSGTVNVSGGSLFLDSNLYVGGAGTGVLNLTDSGSVTVGAAGDGTVTLGIAFGSSGTVNFGTGGAAGTLRAAVISGNLGGIGIVNFNHTGSYTVNQVLSGNGLSVNQYAGTTVLTQANGYIGDTTVAGGTLELAFSSSAPSFIVSEASYLVMAGGTLSLTGGGSSLQAFSAMGIDDFTGSSIIIGADQTLMVGSLTAGNNAALNFDTSAGGADAGNADVGSSPIYLFTSTIAGNVIRPGFTVTDSTGFGLATPDGSSRVVRLTTTDLLPASGASSAMDYRIDNNAGSSSAPGSSSLIITADQSVRSITVDTTAGSGVLTMGSGSALGADIWNFGGAGSHDYTITGNGSITNTTVGGLLMINNRNNDAPVTLGVNIVSTGGGGVLFTGPGTTILTTTSSYGGDTSVTNGVLQAEAGGGIVNTTGKTVIGGSYLNNSGGSAVLNIVGGSMSDGSSTLGLKFGSTGTVNVSSGGSWTTYTDMVIGDAGTGILNLSDGTVESNVVLLGGLAGARGSVTVSGGSLTASNSLSVGGDGTGVVNLSGGMLDILISMVGAGTGSGTVNVSGGTWSNNLLNVGTVGTGVVNLSGGTISSVGAFLGNSTGASGTVNVSGGTWSGGGVFVGNQGTGVINISGGALALASVSLGEIAGSSGTVNMSGGTWSSAGSVYVGSVGTGLLNLSGGSINFLDLAVGNAPGASGTMNVSGGTLSASSLNVGSSGTGVLNLTDSGIITIAGGGGILSLGSSGGSSGTVNFGTGGVAGTLHAFAIVGSLSTGTAMVNFNHTGDYLANFGLYFNLTLNQTGPGTTILQKQNFYVGPTNVLGGTLELDMAAFFASDILPGITDLTLGNATLQLTGAGSQSLNSLITAAGTTGRIVVDNNASLAIYGLTIGSGSALNFNTAAGGADAGTANLGTGVVYIAGLTPGDVISPTFTVTDATGFGLATVDVGNFVVRLIASNLLPATGALGTIDYLIDNNAGTSSDAGSATLTISTPESARSITVDTTAASGVLTLGTGVLLDTGIWNFGGNGTNSYSITGLDPSAGITTTAGSLIQFNNFNAAPITIDVPIIDGPGPVSVTFSGPGTTILSSESTYTGNTTVTSGELQIIRGDIATLGDTTIGVQTGDYAVLTVDRGYFEDEDGILGAGAGSTGIATVGANAEWNHNGDFYIGKNGTGVLNIIDGFSGTSGDVHIGYGAGSSGTVTVGTTGVFAGAPGVLEVQGTLYVGQGGAGTLNLSDLGVVTTDFVRLGAQGTLNIGTGGVSGILDVLAVTSDSSTAVVNFNVSPFNFPVPFDATLTGNLSVNKLGGGVTVLDFPNTYTGRTSVLGGVLNLDFGITPVDVISSASALTLGGGALVLSDSGSQTFNGLTTVANTASSIQLDADNTLTLGALTLGQNSALNFDVSFGGADGATVGTSLVIFSGLTPGEVISPQFTVTDDTGFGLATVNAENQVIRLTGSDLLPATGAVGTVDYRIDNNGGLSTDPGSATLTITASESARSITVDTTAGSGVLTLSGGAVLSTDLWNVGGYSASSYAPYEIASTDTTSGISTATAGGVMRINNYAFDELIISAPILDNGGSGLHVSGTGTTILESDVSNYTGQTTVSGGASLVISGDLSGVTGDILVQSGSFLSGTGTIGGNIQLKAGGSLVAGNAAGCGCGGYTLNGTTVAFESGSIFLVQGDSTTLSTLHLTGAATIQPGAVISFFPLFSGGPLTQSSYTLITAASGLDAATPFTMDVYGIDPRYKLVYTGTELNLQLAALAVAYWTGAVDNKWSTLTGGASNWSTTVNGVPDAAALPDAPTDVIFSATGVGLQQTELDVDFTINSLTVATPTTISTTGTQTLTVGTTTTISSLLAINSGVTLSSQGALTIDNSGTLAGSGAVEMAADQSLFVNGSIIVGDPTTLPLTAAVLSLTTSGTGEIVMDPSGLISVNLYGGAGLGDNTANPATADQLKLTGILNANAGGTFALWNPLGMTTFAGGDQWKVIDYNGGAGSIVGTLTMNDSGVNLPTGFIGSFDQATGIYSIADNRAQYSAQSTGLPMAGATSQAIISGSQTVTNDVNNHLFSLRGGGGEEGDDDDGGISASLDYGVIEGEGDGPEDPIARRVKRSRQWEVFTTVAYGNARLNPINAQSGVQIDSWASSVGIERHVSRSVTVGFAASFLQSSQTYTGGIGSLDLEGPALSAYVAYARKGLWASLLYSFGAYDLGSTRNPGLGLPSASGATNAYTNSIQFNTGWNFRFQNRTLVTGPFIGIDYLHGSVDAYSETGGGLAALAYGRQTFQSLVTRIGWSVSKKLHTEWADITPQFRLSYERQNVHNNGTSVSLINAPFTAAGGSQMPGQDYMVLATGVNFQFTPDFSMLLGYQVQLFRNSMSSHFASVRFGYKF